MHLVLVMYLLFPLFAQSQTYHTETFGPQVGHMPCVNREKKAGGDDFDHKKVTEYSVSSHIKIRGFYVELLKP